MNVALRWLGAGGFTFHVGKRILAIDPQLTLPLCDCILVTHSHFSGLGSVPSIALRTGAVVAGSPNTCRLLAVLGVPARQTREVQAGDRLPLAGFEVEVLRARDDRGDLCLGYRVRAGLISLLTDMGGRCTGDARADILLASPRHPLAALALLFRQVRPRLVIPPARQPNPARLARAVRRSGIDARVLVPEILRENDIRALL